MSVGGVFWDGPLEDQPGFRLVPLVRAFIHEYAADLMTFPWLVHGGRPDAVLVSPDGYFEPDRGVNEGPARIDQAVAADGRVVAVMCGGQGQKRVQNRSPRTYQLLIAKPEDSAIDLRSMTLLPGQMVELEYRVGRILVAIPQ